MTDAYLEGFKTCSSCKRGKSKCEFYSKGGRVDSACKNCIKHRKRLARNAKKTREERYRNNRITFVTVSEAKICKEDVLRDIKNMETILENLVFETLTENLN